MQIIVLNLSLESERCVGLRRIDDEERFLSYRFVNICQNLVGMLQRRISVELTSCSRELAKGTVQSEKKALKIANVAAR
jgi:hypothetical protein